MDRFKRIETLSRWDDGPLPSIYPINQRSTTCVRVPAHTNNTSHDQEVRSGTDSEHDDP